MKNGQQKRSVPFDAELFSALDQPIECKNGGDNQQNDQCMTLDPLNHFVSSEKTDNRLKRFDLKLNVHLSIHNIITDLSLYVKVKK